MKACEGLHDYRDRLLEGEQRASFEAHLAKCPECREAVALWDALERELGEMDREGKESIPKPSGSAVRDLVHRAEGGRGMSFAPKLVAVAAAIAVVIIGVAVLVTQTGGEPDVGEPVAEARGSKGAAVPAVVRFISSTETRTEDLSLNPGDTIPAAENARTLLELGRDRIGFGGPTDAVLEELGERAVRVRLQKGAVACQVAPREKGQRFEVTAGAVTVRVVGTRFMVSRVAGSVHVLVDEGVVEVQQRDEPAVTTRAGQGLEISPSGDVKRIEAPDDEREQLKRLVTEDRDQSEPKAETDDSLSTPSETAEPSPNSAGRASGDRGPRTGGIDDWRAWILEGRYDDAERALSAHLARKPNDSEALVLLADCNRKAGKWRGAVSAYERLIQTAGPSRANVARFKAGVLYQERLRDHAAAARMFDGYLKAGGAKPLEAEAMLRLGRSLLALGRKQQAETVLRRTAERHDGSMASLRARELLKKIADEK